ncbi:MAG: mechanosensitive ion channel family protein [Bacteroidia bacterium]|nr:mechanosensitive ion channel family protein [Bacteroidia bacterium]
MELDFFKMEFLGNSLQKWSISIGIILGTLLLNRFLAKGASRASYKFFKNVATPQFYEEFSRLFNQPFVNLINVIAVYVACDYLTFPEQWNLAPIGDFGLRWMLHALFMVVLIYTITVLFLRVADFMEYVYHNREDGHMSKDLASFLKELTKVLVYIISFFAILAKAFEVNITALVTSLGIGGLAIALAAQDTLANLIGSFIIYLDKPFQVGELIEVGEIKGTVEKIGFRTTRIRTLDKSLLIVPNKKIIDSNLNNIAQSTQRRVRFVIGLTYQSEPENILKIVEEIKLAIQEEAPNTAEEMTVRFLDFDSSSLNLLVVYFVNSNDYNLMVEVKEKINIKIMEIVEKQGCEFAYPSQTIFLNQQN